MLARFLKTEPRANDSDVTYVPKDTCEVVSKVPRGNKNTIDDVPKDKFNVVSNMRKHVKARKNGDVPKENNSIHGIVLKRNINDATSLPKGNNDNANKVPKGKSDDDVTSIVAIRLQILDLCRNDRLITRFAESLLY